MDVVGLNIEFLAIDLLGKSLADDDDEFVQEYSIQEVAKIGIQMVRWFVNDIFHLSIPDLQASKHALMRRY